MEVETHSERVKHSRKMVIEFLASSVDLSVMPDAERWIEEYGADPERYGPPAPPFEAGERDRLRAGHHETPDGEHAATVHQPTKVDNELYVRDYSKCILCYKCVEGCGTDWQNTFAIAVAGRGFDARIATEFANPLPDSACVYCGNCIAVCPTGALMFKSEYDMREAGHVGRGAARRVTTTICTYCGVGCNLELHEQDNEIVKVTSPLDHPVTQRQPLHQGPLRLPVRPERPRRPAAAGGLGGGPGSSGPVSARTAASSVVFRRCEGEAEAVETPVGLLPAEGEIEHDGLDMSAEAMADLLSVDLDLVKEQLPQVKEHLAKFGDNLPAEVSAQLQALEQRLG